MWFTKQQIYTPALDKVVKGNKTYLSLEIREILIDDFVAFEVDVLRYTATDLFEKLNKGVRTNRSRISKCLKDDYKLEPYNGSYKKYFWRSTPIKKQLLILKQKKGNITSFWKAISSKTCWLLTKHPICK